MQESLEGRATRGSAGTALHTCATMTSESSLRTLGSSRLSSPLVSSLSVSTHSWSNSTITQLYLDTSRAAPSELRCKGLAATWRTCNNTPGGDAACCLPLETLSHRHCCAGGQRNVVLLWAAAHLDPLWADVLQHRAQAVVGVVHVDKVHLAAPGQL